MGLSTFCTLSRIGLAKLLKNSPAFICTLVKLIVGLLPNVASGASVGALVNDQATARSVLMVGKFAPPPNPPTRCRLILAEAVSLALIISESAGPAAISAMVSLPSLF